MRVLVCGDRNWENIDAILRELSKLDNNTVIIHGAARGADTLAGIAGKELGFKVEAEPAKWEIYGRSAGPIRNQLMLDKYKPELVLAFHSNIDNSKGTKDMVTRARKAGIKVVIFER